MAERPPLPTQDTERLVARAEWALNWLVKRIDHLDPGSQMVVRNHQQVMVGRVREALAEARRLEFDLADARAELARWQEAYGV